MTVHSSFAIILIGNRAGCFNLFVFLVSRDCCVALPHDTTDVSVVCDCGIPGHSHLLFLAVMSLLDQKANLCTIAFHSVFSQHVLISSEHFLNKNYLSNQKTSQQRDLYLNKQFRFPMVTSEKVRVNVIFGYN